MIYLLVLILVGCGLGTITGLTPGLHVNTVCLIGLSIYSKIGLSSIDFGVVMVAMSVTHTFIDFIPAIFIGVPEESTAMSILPAHRLLLQGRSLEVVWLTTYGSLLGLVYSIVLLIPVMYIIPIIYEMLKEVIMYFVLIFVIVLIVREKNKTIALYCFIISGWLGYVALNMKALSGSQVLFPLFAGLFGISNMIISLKDKAANTPQKKDIKVELNKNIAFSGLVGSLCGIIVGLLPAMSPSQVGIIAYDILGANMRGFLVSVSAINTSDAIYSLVSLYTINNARSGVATMLSQIMALDFNTLLLFIGVTATTAVIATTLYMYLGRKAMDFVSKINYTKLNSGILLFIILLVYYMTGWIGLGGIVYSELLTALYEKDAKSKVKNFIVGLGGKDVKLSHVREIIKNTMEDKGPTEQWMF